MSKTLVWFSSDLVHSSHLHVLKTDTKGPRLNPDGPLRSGADELITISSGVNENGMAWTQGPRPLWFTMVYGVWYPNNTGYGIVVH